MNDNSLTNYLEAQKLLKTISQTDFLDFFSSLLKEQQELLIESIRSIDIEKFNEQTNLFNEGPSPLKNITPFLDLIDAGSKEKQEIGLKVLEKGEGAAILIAGGAGTRLGHSGPKGTFPVSATYNKSLFQIFCERVKKRSLEVKQDLMLIIMTSPFNDSLTRRYLKEHQYFGLKESQVLFFVQETLPYLDLEGNLFLSENCLVAKGPDGNGHCFHQLHRQGLLPKLEKQGIRYFNIVFVDNPLADPYDPELFGELKSREAEVVIKSCTRVSKDEKVGVIAKVDGKPRIVEYHELAENQLFDHEPAANLGLFATTLEFAKKAAFISLPLHKVKKKVPYFDSEVQKAQVPKAPNAWKFEYYIFDLFPHAEKTHVLNYNRESVFSPLKNREGSCSPKTVRDSLLKIGIE